MRRSEAPLISPVKRERGKGCADIFERLVTKRGDPETAVPRWLATRTPLVIVHEIEACGIFPPLTPEASEATAQLFMDPVTMGPDFSNYASYKESMGQMPMLSLIGSVASGLQNGLRNAKR